MTPSETSPGLVMGAEASHPIALEPPSAPKHPQCWNDAPLPAKVYALAAAAAVLGCLIGLLEARLGNLVWPMSLGLLLLLGGLCWLASVWIVDPVQNVLTLCEQLWRERLPRSLRRLPVWRQDEAGRMARLMYQATAAAIRDNYDAQQLRRTLDHRVQQATHAATRRLRQLTMRDPLTDLGNRRFLDENLDELVKSILDSRSQLVCVMMDLDHFKQVNDQLGHAQGDQLLTTLASILRSNIRREDLAMRLGGDEFCLLLPNCERQRVDLLLERIRALFRQHVHQALPGVPADLSFGVSVLPNDGPTNGPALLQSADADLYAHKRKRR